MSDIVDHSAGGQALGYDFQFDRAVFHLLNASSEVLEVGVEDEDDVNILLSSGHSVREQDKFSTAKGNPITDRSVALWKTLHIWIEAIHHEPQLLINTSFYFATNRSITKNCIADRINNAVSDTQAEQLADEILDMADNLRDDLKPYGRTILSIERSQFIQLIQRIFVTSSVNVNKDLDNVPALRLVEPEHRIHVFSSVRTWVKNKIQNHLENKRRPRVTLKDFEVEARNIVRLFRIAPLAASVQPPDPNLSYDNYWNYGFVKQLEDINMNDNFIRSNSCSELI